MSWLRNCIVVEPPCHLAINPVPKPTPGLVDAIAPSFNAASTMRFHRARIDFLCASVDIC